MDSKVEVMEVDFEFCVLPVSAPACFAQQRSLKERVVGLGSDT